GGNQTISILFTPIYINRLKLKNRIIMAQMGMTSRGTQWRDGIIRQRFKDFFAARARGGVGLIMVGNCSVDVSIAYGRLSLYDDRFIPGLRELVDSIHAFDVPVGINLQHPGRQGSSTRGKYPLVAPSPIPRSPSSEVPKELSVTEIEDLVEKFAETARRAKEAGFDLVEIYGSHGMLISQFLSPHSNKRTDEYGGDLMRRSRFAVEIIKRAREKIGADFPLSIRLNGEDHVEGGLTLEESKVIAPLLVQAGVDLINVSAGVFGSYPVIIPPYDTPFGCNSDLAAEVKSVVSVPVGTVGRINDPRFAEEILLAGKADLIAMARPLLADPDLPSKALKGQFDEIRKCIGCNQGCYDRYERVDSAYEAETSCLVNPMVQRERELEIVPAKEKKTVMVVGGGLAGLEVARVAALRGYEVTLYEEDSELGGQWIMASKPPHKEEFREAINYLCRQVRKVEVTLELGKLVTSTLVEKARPDVVVIATGAVPIVPAIPGVERENVVTAWDILQGKARVGDRVLVVGGSATGLETAELLAAQGKNVVIAEMLEHLGRDIGSTVRFHLRHRLSTHGVKLFKSTKIIEITEEGVVVITEGKEEIWRDFNTIVLAVGSRSRNELAGEIKDKVAKLYIIGDASSPRNGLEAIREGTEVGRQI
ncbi:FAD-dependent oxidoreductase, partial [Chloroflexota bacterium]